MGYPTNAVVLPENNKKTNRLFSARRERRGIKPIMLGNAARGVVSALRRNEFVAILADRDYTSHERQVDFFGTPAYLPLGPATLCIKAGAPILPAFLVRREDDSYLMRFAEPIFAGPRDTLDSIQASVCRTLEAEILKDPTQWYMFHEFWDYTGEGKQPARGEER
jgi:KDO2-lipid IV(A) lauroyltransferase